MPLQPLDETPDDPIRSPSADAPAVLSAQVQAKFGSEALDEVGADALDDESFDDDALDDLLDLVPGLALCARPEEEPEAERPEGPSRWSVADLLARLAAPSRSPAGVTAAAVAGAMGLALYEKALAQGAPDAPPPLPSHRQVLGQLRERLLELADADVVILSEWAEPAEGDDEPLVARHLAAYRSTRKLLDATIQGLSLVPPVLDCCLPELLADVETGTRMLGSALYGAVACAEDHLRELTPAFAESERPAFDTQFQQGRELLERAEGGLSWRRGKA